MASEDSGSSVKEEEESGVSLSASSDIASAPTMDSQSLQEIRTGSGEDLPSFLHQPSRSLTMPHKIHEDDGEVKSKSVPRTAPHKLDTYEPSVEKADEQEAPSESPAEPPEERHTSEPVSTPSRAKSTSTSSSSSSSSLPPGQSGACGGAPFEPSENIENNTSSGDGGEYDDMPRNTSTLEVKGSIDIGGNKLSYEFKGEPQDVHKQSESYKSMVRLMHQSSMDAKSRPSKTSSPPSSSSSPSQTNTEQTNTEQPITMPPITSTVTNTKPPNGSK